MLAAETAHDRPALASIVRDTEADAVIQALLKKRGRISLRFRQLCGVIVKMKMGHLGWMTTGRKGSLAALSRFFTQAERYVPETR